MNSTWLVVADSSRARVFTMESRRSPIHEIESIVHEQSRLHERDMTSDLPGRANGRMGAGGHAYQDEISPKAQESINFAREVANELDEARKSNKFKQLVLVAAPAFLGDLRHQLNAQTQKLVCFELAKNLSQLEAVDIRKHLPEQLPGL
ncbi:MAG: host attachment protein [Gammaproteobacteria bacterium]|nr:host attachment protein [Gammaproteobacteria bacterium]